MYLILLAQNVFSCTQNENGMLEEIKKAFRTHAGIFYWKYLLHILLGVYIITRVKLQFLGVIPLKGTK